MSAQATDFCRILVLVHTILDVYNHRNTVRHSLFYSRVAKCFLGPKPKSKNWRAFCPCRVLSTARNTVLPPLFRWHSYLRRPEFCGKKSHSSFLLSFFLAKCAKAASAAHFARRKERRKEGGGAPAGNSLSNRNQNPKPKSKNWRAFCPCRVLSTTRNTVLPPFRWLSSGIVLG